MIKDYLPFEPDSCQKTEINFVESYWTGKLSDTIEAALQEDLTKKDEYKIMARHLEKFPEKATILDGGCGRGEWTVFFSQRGYNVTGLDISEELIGKLISFFPTLNFVRGDIRDTGFPDDTFDIYYSWGAFEHFDEGLASCIREGYRILKDGGYIFVSVPYANGRILRARRVKNIHENEADTARRNETLRFYQWRLTKNDLSNELTRCGFKVLEVTPMHKQEGFRRMLRHDIQWKMSPGSFIEACLFRTVGAIVPAHYVSHMLMGVATKQRQ